MKPWPPSEIPGHSRESLRECWSTQGAVKALCTPHTKPLEDVQDSPKHSRGLRAGSVSFCLLCMSEKGLGAQLTWAMALEKNQWGNTDSSPVRVIICSCSINLWLDEDTTESQNHWGWQGPLERVGSARADCSGRCPVQVCIPSRIETAQSLWATCHSVWQPSQGNYFSYV